MNRDYCYLFRQNISPPEEVSLLKHVRDRSRQKVKESKSNYEEERTKKWLALVQVWHTHLANFQPDNFIHSFISLASQTRGGGGGSEGGSV